MPTLKIDDKEITVEAGTTVIEAARRLGVMVPHFCYHPKLSIAGNCRMCLVEVEKFPKPQISCGLVATEGMVVKTQSENARQWRKNVLEFILINHPLDCPVCDQAGECKLQDYYLSESVKGSAFEEEKVHKPKKVKLGPNVMLDDERCIMCSRCVRFCDEISKTSELGFIQRGDHVELRPFPGKELDNAYSINTVDICPVGALTNADFRFKKRVWFLKTADSICTGCARGCNIKLQYDGDTVYRYLPRENNAVNQVWLCDKGRLGYHAINENRLLTPERKINGEWQRLSPEKATNEVADLIKQSASNIVMIGSAQLSNESLYALKKFSDLIQNPSDPVPLYYSGRVVENPDQDDFLIRADKNPNTTGAEKLGFAKTSSLASGKLVVIAGEISEADRNLIKKSNPSKTIALLTHRDETAEIADYLIPLASFAEETGTFTNFEGRVQKFNPGLKARGQMKPASQWLQDLAGVLKMAVLPSFAEEGLQKEFGVSYAELGSEGVLLKG